MTPDITTAMDEVAATDLLHKAEAQYGTVTGTSTGQLGPFTVHRTLTAHLGGGAVQLLQPNVVRAANVTAHYSVHLDFILDINPYIPPLHVGPWQVTIKVGPFKIKITIPGVTVLWPVVALGAPKSDAPPFEVTASCERKATKAS